MNKEQGIPNIEVYFSDHNSVFLVPCSLFKTLAQYSR